MSEILKDTNGVTSSVRVGMMICILTASGLAFFGLHKGVDLTSLGLLCGTFLAAGIGGKVYQKGKE